MNCYQPIETNEHHAKTGKGDEINQIHVAMKEIYKQNMSGGDS